MLARIGIDRARRPWFFLSFALLSATCKQTAPGPVHRVELRKLGGELIELVPLEGTPSNCLVFSVSHGGVVRQLTMNEENTSFECQPGEAIGGQPFRIPAREGSIRIYTLFSSQNLAAGPIAEQIDERASSPDFSVLDLRAPGQVVTDMVEFVPEPPP
jgi:hypothetical protein